MDLFTYGTLQLEEVWRRVAGCGCETVPATAEGFAVYRVDGYDFPGMTPEPGATASGLIYRGVDGGTLARLDAYEGEFYERREIEVRRRDTRVEVCDAYVLPTRNAALLTAEPWTVESFIANGGLERFRSRS